mmetsp:Transcript_889/g.1584  ORF Transcript_889/g.1584 Transcript_889/m.1584 type:complete len:265 (+) Transcript_889:758-1552(+)
MWITTNQNGHDWCSTPLPPPIRISLHFLRLTTSRAVMPPHLALSSSPSPKSLRTRSTPFFFFLTARSRGVLPSLSLTLPAAVRASTSRYSTTSSFPLRLARWRGVCPYESVLSTCSPRWWRSPTMPTSPLYAPQWRAESSFLSRTEGDAPRFMRNPTSVAWPYWAATRRGEQPEESWESMSTPRARRRLTTPTADSVQAQCMGLMPTASLLGMSSLHPLSARYSMNRVSCLFADQCMRVWPSGPAASRSRQSNTRSHRTLKAEK